MKRCPVCQKTAMDESTRQALEYETFASIREKFLHWLKWYGLFISIAAALVLALLQIMGGFLLGKYVDSRLEEPTRQVIEKFDYLRAEADSQFQKNTSTIDEKLQIQTKTVIKEKKRLERKILNELTELVQRGTFPGKTSLAVDARMADQSYPLLLSPNTFSEEPPSEFFHLPIDLRWVYDEGQPGVDVFRVEWSRSADFPKDQVGFKNTILHMYQLTKEDLCPPDASSGDCQESGRYFWRVQVEPSPGTTAIHPPSVTGQFVYFKTALDRILERRAVRIGISPFDLGDFAKEIPKDGGFSLEGLDIEIAEKIVGALGSDSSSTIKPIFLDFPWDELFDALADNRVDMIISNISITSQREELYGIKFSDPYCFSKKAIVMKKDGHPPLSTLRDKYIGVFKGTTGEDFVKKYVLKGDESTFSQIVPETTEDALIQGLKEQRIAAFFTDADLTIDYENTHPALDPLILHEKTLQELGLEKETIEEEDLMEKFGLAVRDEGQANPGGGLSLLDMINHRLPKILKEDIQWDKWKICRT